jgi:indole-3-acetate monooxygenase
MPDDGFIDAAKGLAPQIQASAEEIEQSRRLPLPLVEAMAQAGLFRLWIPRTLGGAFTGPGSNSSPNGRFAVGS